MKFATNDLARNQSLFSRFSPGAVLLITGLWWGVPLKSVSYGATFFSEEIENNLISKPVLQAKTADLFRLQLSQLPTFSQGQNDNQDRFIQPPPTPLEPLEPDSEGITPQEDAPPPPVTTPQPMEGDIEVNSISLEGSSIFSPEDFAESFRPFIGQRVSMESLQQLGDLVTERYLELGYITSRAVLDSDSVAGGNIRLQVVEGGIEEIQVEGLRRLKPHYIRRRVALGARTPLNTADLENQLRLLRADTLLDNVEASLRTGTQAGQSILVVRVTEASNFRGTAFSDNFSPASVGSERIGTRLNYYNLSGLGDVLGVEFTRTAQGGSNTLDWNYRIPVNAMNGTFQVRNSFNTNQVILSTDIFDIRGNTQLYELSFRQPLVRSPREEFALSLGFTYQQGQTFTIFGPTPIGIGAEEDGRTRTSVIKFGQDYTRRDAQGAWALRSQFSFGVDGLNATVNPNPIPDTRFVSWLGQIQRVQVVNPNYFIIAGLDLQWASTPLLPSQQFVVGGGQSVRGYRQNVRTGDNGLRFSLENRFTVLRDEGGDPTLILAPFADVGYVWNNSNNLIGPVDQGFIAGVGVSLLWQPISGLNIRLDYGYPLIQLRDRGNNAQDSGLYFNVILQF